MRISASIFTIAVGAILTFAVHVQTNGFSLHTVGIILMIVGAGALALTLVLMSQRSRTVVRRDSVQKPLYTDPAPPTQVGYAEPVRQRTTYVEQDAPAYDDPRIVP